MFPSGGIGHLTPVHLFSTVDVGSRRRLRSASIRRRWSYRPHDAPRWVIEPSRRLLLERGIFSSVVCSFCAIAAAVPPRPQDGTACFSHRTLHHSVQLCDRLYNLLFRLRSVILIFTLTLQNIALPTAISADCRTCLVAADDELDAALADTSSITHGDSSDNI